MCCLRTSQSRRAFIATRSARAASQHAVRVKQTRQPQLCVLLLCTCDRKGLQSSIVAPAGLGFDQVGLDGLSTLGHTRPEDGDTLLGSGATDSDSRASLSADPLVGAVQHPHLDAQPSEDVQAHFEGARRVGGCRVLLVTQQLAVVVAKSGVHQLPVLVANQRVHQTLRVRLGGDVASVGCRRAVEALVRRVEAGVAIGGAAFASRDLAALVDCADACPLRRTREEGFEVPRAVAVVVDHREPAILSGAEDVAEEGDDAEHVAGEDAAGAGVAVLELRVHVHDPLP
mmetsp:Transcript_9814/g.23346  ORF Transcript_9814/g.23346 Transcript_9814/m.23346 type:complete len:286 (-) Transcript_9814:1368-2225(-)